MAAVLTADIVHSTALSKAAHRGLLDELKALLSISQVHEFYRGDSFQAYFESALPAFRCALQLRAAALRLSTGTDIFDIRCSIGIADGGTVSSVRTATGPAFLLSGRGLDALDESGRLLAISSGKEGADLPLSLIARYADFLMRHLTGRQAAVIFELLQERSQLEAAQKLQKAPATISQHVHAGGWPELEALLGDYQNVLIQYAL